MPSSRRQITFIIHLINGQIEYLEIAEPRLQKQQDKILTTLPLPKVFCYTLLFIITLTRPTQARCTTGMPPVRQQPAVDSPAGDPLNGAASLKLSSWSGASRGITSQQRCGGHTAAMCAKRSSLRGQREGAQKSENTSGSTHPSDTRRPSTLRLTPRRVRV